MRLSPAPVRSRTRGARTGTGPRPVMIARSVSIRSRSTILSLVIVISGIRFKLRNSNPNRRPAVTAPGVRYAREGFAHALSGSVLHHAQGRHERSVKRHDPVPAEPDDHLGRLVTGEVVPHEEHAQRW